MFTYLALCLLTQFLAFIFSIIWKFDIYKVKFNNPVGYAIFAISLINLLKIYNIDQNYNSIYFIGAFDFAFSSLLLLLIGIEYYDFNIKKIDKLLEEKNKLIDENYLLKKINIILIKSQNKLDEEIDSIKSKLDGAESDRERELDSDGEGEEESDGEGEEESEETELDNIKINSNKIIQKKIMNAIRIIQLSYENNNQMRKIFIDIKKEINNILNNTNE